MSYWVIYKYKDKLEQPKAIPFEHVEIMKLWLEQQKLRVDVIDITFSINS